MDTETPEDETLPSGTIKKRPSMFVPMTGKGWDELSEQQKYAKLRQLRERCIQKESSVLMVESLRTMANGQSPAGAVLAAAREFGITVRQMQKLVNHYFAYRRAYPDAPGAEAFMPLSSGRPAGQMLTAQQQEVITYAFAERVRTARSALDRRRQINVVVNILDVYVLTKTILEYKHLSVPSYQTVYRFLQSFKQRNEALYYSIVNGDDAVEANLMAKRRNDVDYPNQRWQSDACDPPMYVSVDGEATPISIIVIFDDYSKYIVGWSVIPKITRDNGKVLKRNTFTGQDVVRMFCTAMHTTGVRPEVWYTDNGSQYLKADRSIQELNGFLNSPITITHSRPRKPWGRGKIENAIGKLQSWISNAPGTYRKRDRASIRAARANKQLYTLDEFRAELANHFAHLNTQSRKGGPSRYDIWRRATSHAAPTIHQMASLEVLEAKEENVKINRWATQFLNTPWEPKQTDADASDIYRIWMDAIASRKSFRVHGVRLDTGWCAEAFVQGRWVQLIRKDEQTATIQHLEDSNTAFTTMKEQRRELIMRAREEILKLTDGSIPELVTAESTYTIPEPQEPAPTPEPTPTAKRSRAKSSAAKKHVVQPAAFSEPFPDMEALLREKMMQAGKHDEE